MSETSISNTALLTLGETPLLSFDDDISVKADQCRHFYPIERDALLRAYPWNFATVRKTLQQDPTPPEWKWAYRYVLPADNLRILKIMDERYGIEWFLESGFLVTDEAAIKIKYIQQVTETGRFDSLFTKLLGLQLAVSIAYATTRKATVTDRLEARVRKLEMEAFNIDSSESTGETLEDDELLDVR